jgi:hypothetical protein
MKRLLIIFGLFTLGLVYGQEGKTTDFLVAIQKFDVSDLFTLDKFNIENDTVIVSRLQPLEFIGENFQRLQIRFISVIKNPSNSFEYFVYGKSRVKNNICSFQGKLTIKKSYLFESDEYPSIKQGNIEGEYEFYEDPDNKGTGIFKGVFTTCFYIQKNELKYNALMWSSDGFENNQFEGKWISYKSGDTKKCNWGDYRIPDSGDLDIGAGEFGPDEKYKNFGWDNYRLAWINLSDKTETNQARQKENERWWIDK